MRRSAWRWQQLDSRCTLQDHSYRRVVERLRGQGAQLVWIGAATTYPAALVIFTGGNAAPECGSTRSTGIRRSCVWVVMAASVYRIASAPWSGSYYVSADAFYNNGQTSGSLVGTPFVDSNVPNC